MSDRISAKNIFAVLNTLSAIEKEKEELRILCNAAGRNKGYFCSNLGKIPERTVTCNIDKFD